MPSRAARERTRAERVAAKFGLVVLEDGSYAKAQPNSKVGHAMSVPAEWGEDDQPIAAPVFRRHRSAVREFAADVKRERVARARRSRSSRPADRVRTRAREHRPAETRRASSSSSTSSDPPSGDDSDPEPSEEGRCDCGCDQPRRFCACGCRRDITHRRGDAKTFGASCRQRIARASKRAISNPLEPRFCQCESGFFYRDAEGDAVCGLCGCWLGKIATRINGFDAFDALLRSNGTHVARRPIAKRWDDTQAAARRRGVIA